ncbi:MAG: GNAT family N-acetyltransferase [Candidatus Dormibacteria bacterium]
MTEHPRSHLNELIHQPVRFSIMAALASAGEVEFASARDTVQISDSLLSRYALQLEDAGYLAVRKGHVGRRPRTWLSLTPVGDAALSAHLEALRAIAGLGAGSPAGGGRRDRCDAAPSGTESGTLELREAVAGADDTTVIGLFIEYLTWAGHRLLNEHGVDDVLTDTSRVPESLNAFRRPRGILLLAERDSRAAGVGALRRLARGVVEVKRMYVVPDRRGQHVGSAILDRLIAEARGMGATTLRLDTCRFMTEAQRLYRSRGFVEREPYEGTEIPPHLRHHWMFFERGMSSLATGHPDPAPAGFGLQPSGERVRRIP